MFFLLTKTYNWVRCDDDDRWAECVDQAKIQRGPKNGYPVLFLE